MSRNRVIIPFNKDHMTMNEVKQVLGSMSAMLDRAHAMRDSYREESAEKFLANCEDFYWRFQTVTQNMSTWSIEEEKRNG